ncbi:MAG: 1-(5-phosphoribosyl)-5-[(5-phosphoribosylamino)methylideneamino]imidazole-4-carboxamide isomerase [Pyrinomonadaceae bacterium]
MIEIIPAIDVIEGRCVRLKQGDFSQRTFYCAEPLEMAKEFESQGIRRLHVVDLDGAKIGKVMNLKTLEKLAANTNLDIDFGGGIKTDADIEAVFNAGAKIAGIGSVAVKEPDKFFGWLAKYGGEKILLGADVKDEKIAINGWQTTTELDLLPFLKKYYVAGVTQVFVTDVSKDGLLQGASCELYKKILKYLPRLNLIASGGVSSMEDVAELEKIGCAGVIIGKAIYEDRINLSKIGASEYSDKNLN